jgi:nucleoside-diphosphate-sugar epimerase
MTAAGRRAGEGGVEVETVLVTGATGWIAKFCIIELLDAGFRVRGTVRNLRWSDAVRRCVDPQGERAHLLEFAAADLTRDEGWDGALAGCAYVLHVASPFPMRQPRHPEEVVAPARDGTLRVLAAARRAGVGRVVMTSSTAAIIYPSDSIPGRTYSEADWTDPARRDISPYVASKTLAERAAWEFVRANSGPELTVVNPGFVQGPALDADLSTSLRLIRTMAQGGYPATPRTGFSMVDVRDVAAMHVLAMTHPHAGSERFVCANGYLTFREIAAIVADTLPDAARNMPKWEVPDAVVSALAYFDRSLLAVRPDLGHRRLCDNRKAREKLGFNFRSPSDAVAAAARSLRALRLV